jgi:uncharacterized membrane protein (UPF0182 family)
VASYACKTVPKTLEYLCRTIYNHFADSASRVSTFGEFQDFCNMGRLKILAPGQTRWLSVHACVRRILQLWEPLKLYFRNLEFEDPTYGNELVFNALQNPLMKIMMMLMEYILGLLTSLIQCSKQMPRCFMF